MMSRSPLTHYKKELVRCVFGHSRRKALLAAFHQSLIPFLEENATPSYEDLINAFGPPKHMAQDLLQSTPLPASLSRMQKISIIVCCCIVIFSTALGIFFLHNTPETGTVLSSPFAYPSVINDHHYFPIDDPITFSGSQWKQPSSFNKYLVEISNSGQTKLTANIYYSSIQPRHILEISPGDTVTFMVNDSCSSKHEISFSSPDGALSGKVRVFVSH